MNKLNEWLVWGSPHTQAEALRRRSPPLIVLRYARPFKGEAPARHIFRPTHMILSSIVMPREPHHETLGPLSISPESLKPPTGIPSSKVRPSRCPQQSVRSSTCSKAEVLCTRTSVCSQGETTPRFSAALVRALLRSVWRKVLNL